MSAPQHKAEVEGLVVPRPSNSCSPWRTQHRPLLGLVVLSLFSKQRQDMDRSTIFMFPYKICVIFANHDGEMAVEELAIDYVSELLSMIWP